MFTVQLPARKLNTLPEGYSFLDNRFINIVMTASMNFLKFSQKFLFKNDQKEVLVNNHFKTINESVRGDLPAGRRVNNKYHAKHDWRLLKDFGYWI